MPWGGILDFQNVGYFLALCEEKNFCRAAKRCGIAQPSLTNAIKRLEKQLGGALFLRRPCVEPTPLAVALKPYFEQILLSAHLARHEANRILAKKSGPHRSAGAKTSASVAMEVTKLAARTRPYCPDCPFHRGRHPAPSPIPPPHSPLQAVGPAAAYGSSSAG